MFRRQAKLPLPPALVSALDGPIPALDVGAAGGLSALWRSAGLLLQVDAFEPDANECRNQQKVAPTNVTWFPVALAGSTGRRDFFVLNRSTGSSLFPPNDEVLGQFAPTSYRGVKAKIDVDCVSLGDFLDRYQRPSPRLIKLDTQGSELEILQSLRPAQLDEVLWIETEVEFRELYRDQPRFCDVDAFLQENGFQLLDLRTHRAYLVADDIERGYLRRDLATAAGSRRLSAHLVAGDALYTRSPADPRLTEDGPTAASYLVGAALYRYFDLALAFLDRPAVSSVWTRTEIDELINELRRLAPTPRVWERTGRGFDLARKIVNRAFPDHGGHQVFWTRRAWPDQ
jgi:FkbM family methyltransferase